MPCLSPDMLVPYNRSKQVIDKNVRSVDIMLFQVCGRSMCLLNWTIQCDGKRPCHTAEEFREDNNNSPC